MTGALHALNRRGTDLEVISIAQIPRETFRTQMRRGLDSLEGSLFFRRREQLRLRAWRGAREGGG